MSETPKPVIIIVPGMFQRAAHYAKVTQRLQQCGYEVLVSELATLADEDNLDPKLDHVDDARAIQKVFEPVLDQGKKAVVVAHSYGSLPAAVAFENQTTAERSARGLKGGLEAFVTVSGYAFPARGKSAMNDDNDPPLAPFLHVSVCHYSREPTFFFFCPCS